MVGIAQMDIIIINSPCQISAKTQEQTRLESDQVDWSHHQESNHFKISEQMRLPVPPTIVLSCGWS